MDQEWSPIFKIFDVQERSLQNACFRENFYVAGNNTY